MNFPKIGFSLNKLKETIIRFPVAIIISVAVCAVLIYMEYLASQPGNDYGQSRAILSYISLALEAILGVSVAIKLFSEKYKLSNVWNYLMTGCISLSLQQS
jgi:hypothetical protein